MYDFGIDYILTDYTNKSLSCFIIESVTYSRIKVTFSRLLIFDELKLLFS